MRYMTLKEMRDMLRDEANMSRNIAHGVTQIEQQNSLIQRVQEDLYLNFDWPHLRAVANREIDPNQRYAAYPDTFEYTGIDAVYWQSPDQEDWWLLAYGIGAPELNWIDSDAGQTENNVQHWQNYMQPAADEQEPGAPPITGDTSNNMFEVWPVPTAGGTVRFTGKRKLFPLTSDDQTSTLDGPLIVLHGAAEILARQKSEDASLKLQLGRERLRLLRMRQTVNDNRQSNLSGGVSSRPLRAGIDYLNRMT